MKKFHNLWAWCTFIKALSKITHGSFSELMEFSTPFDDEEPKELALRPSDHEQEDGTIFAMCVTGTGSKDSLISWIRYLQKTNPNLEHTKVVFTLRSPDAGYPLLEEKKHLIEDGNYEKEMKQS